MAQQEAMKEQQRKIITKNPFIRDFFVLSRNFNINVTIINNL
jgi:hypothetical protein